MSAAAPDSDRVGRLIAEHLHLARRVARRYSPTSVTDPDLLQVAEAGLFLAARRFDPDRGSFRAFANATISGEVKKHLRSMAWAAHVPRRVQEAVLHVRRESDALTQELGRSPTPAEIADRVGTSVEDVLDARRAERVRTVDMWDGHDDEGSGWTDDSLIDHMDLRAAIRGLPLRDRQLLAMTYGDGLTQRQIADRLDTSQAHVHRRLVAIRRHLRLQLVDGDGRA